MEARKSIGRYQIKRWLAAGAMGEIYEGHDPVIDRPVAIKLVRRELTEHGDADGESWLDRFQHEVRAAGRLPHPNIVTVYDCGEEAGAPYLVMEYVEGESLDRVIKRSGRLALDEAIAIVTQTLGALDFAHARGVIHRDIKPSNILQTKAGLVKLTDFGIAHIAESDLTATNAVMGTLSYMSPEQLIGRAIDRRTDIFAAGVVLFELLGGAKPFEGSLGERLLKMEQRGPSDIRSLNAEVPAALNRVLETALAYDPERRYASAGEFSRAIAEARAAPVAAAAPAMSEDATVVAGSPTASWDRLRDEPSTGSGRSRRPQRPPEPQTRPAEAPPSESPPDRAKAPRRWRAPAIALGAVMIAALAGLALVLSGVLDRPGPSWRTAGASANAAADGAAGAAAVGEVAAAIRIKPPERRQTGAKAGESFRDCPDCPVMVWLPAGRFMMGTELAEAMREGVPENFAKWERPRHAVTVQAVFAIGKFHVTRAEYGRFAAATGRADNAGCNTRTGSIYEADRSKSWRDPGFPQSENDPVVCISWDDAKAYAAWLSQTTGKSYRLPTEAEWEYAARGGTTTARWWGDDAGAMCSNANGPDLTAKEKFSELTVASCKDGYVFTSPVGSFLPNPFGLYDMLGNAWQRTEDCWNESYASAPNDSAIALAAGRCGIRVVRGGAWYGDPKEVRAGARDSFSLEQRFDHTGFRVVRTQ
jgi:formylglycine-generating enzyme